MKLSHLALQVTGPKLGLWSMTYHRSGLSKNKVNILTFPLLSLSTIDGLFILLVGITQGFENWRQNVERPLGIGGVGGVSLVGVISIVGLIESVPGGEEGAEVET